MKPKQFYGPHHPREHSKFFSALFVVMGFCALCYGLYWLWKVI